MLGCCALAWIAWRLGSPQHAEVRMTNGLFFIAALGAVYLMSWRAGWPVFGAAFAMLVGSNPFQLYEAVNATTR